MVSEGNIRTLLMEVMDPEIPVLSLVDLGVIGDIEVKDSSVKVELRPTFVGCPATQYMKAEVEGKLLSLGFEEVEVEISFRSPWNSDMITEKGRQALREYGFAPPPRGGLIEDIDVLEHAECPRCGGTHTELQNPFGPTLCRGIHYCHDCREAFQQFKPLNQ